MPYAAQATCRALELNSMVLPAQRSQWNLGLIKV